MQRLLLFSLLLHSLTFGQEKHQLVNPFIGTGGHGHTYPGVSVPFGMMQLSPDTRLDGWDGCGGYHYSDSVIYGFSHTHLSGTGVSDYGDLLIMPFTGQKYWKNGASTGNKKGYGSRFSHKNEKAHAGYYTVFLTKHNIQCELTTTTRCGMHKYTFLTNNSRKIIIDLDHRDMLTESDLIFYNDTTIVGKRISNAWAREQHFYFAIKLSEPPKERFFQKNKKGKATKLILDFGDQSNQLFIKVGISAVDINGAVKNLNQEMPDWDFEKYKTENEALWDKELNKVEIKTSNKDFEKIFYTALYHSFLNPNTFSDKDGRYRGMDMKIHQSNKHVQYTVFSLWDTFRSTHPLFTILQPDRTNDFIETFLNQYGQGGILPIWELSANYTGCMIGYHAIPVIVDAWMKGYRDFNAELALKAMMHSADQNHLGLEYYKHQGYISSENESESVSKTLEYAYDDWCIAVFADSLGEDTIAERFYKRSQSYKNLYNPSTTFMQPRFNGGWKNGFRPDEVTFDYTEANSWQYSLFVPHDVFGLIQMMGGKKNLENWLDDLFSASSKTTGREQADITGLIGQYAHGNEPSHHMAYLYNFTDNSWKTQKYVHQILTTLYHNRPNGLSGNEDCGQMSSWYVMSSLGFYSFLPGSDTYLLGAPLFESFKINLDNGKSFEMNTKNWSNENIYVKNIILNKKPLKRNYIYHHEIMQGGELIFEMTAEPQTYFGNVPYYKVSKGAITPSPFIKDGTPSFTKKKKIELSTSTPVVAIRYTLDGTEPNQNSLLYTKPFVIKESTVIKAKAFGDRNESFTTTGHFVKANTKWRVKVNTEYANQYSAGGDQALIDQLRGSSDFRTGAWQGYYGTDLDIEIDFRKKLDISKISVSLLQDIKSWIWFPKEVKFMISKNGKNWFSAGVIQNKLPQDQYGPMLQEITLEQKFTTRYLRIVAKSIGKCPSWHLGAGNPTWIFADEIIIE